MNPKDCFVGDGTLKPLTWDSSYFGFAVARIAAPDLDDTMLSQALCAARARSIGLVYWAKTPGRSVSAEVLQEFDGALVDQKATFARDLAEEGESAANTRASTFEIVEYPKGEASPRLLELGVRAGQHSRFQTDLRITAEQFRGLYEIWMGRSTTHELADAVLIALPHEDPAEAVGVVTVSVAAGVGKIGLIAVADRFRGRGIGTSLMRAAHRYIQEAEGRHAEVVTQLANRAACRLYESNGYRVRQVQDFYHFWPLARHES